MSVLETSATPDRLPQRIRLPLRFRRVQVAAVERPAPRLVRITVAGDELDGFDSPGFDDHVKLFFPDPDTGELLFPVAGPDGPLWADARRPLVRDYTPHAHNAVAGTLQLDFVIHAAGPATDWALKAQPGDVLGIGGPRGSMLIPLQFDWHLLVGDETALPAISRRLAQLPADARAIVIAEVETAEDELPLISQASLQVQWCHRNGTAAGTSTVLADALAALSLPSGDGFAWLACESRQARALRQYLVDTRGLNPRRVKAAGYWRLGAAGVHENIDD